MKPSLSCTPTTVALLSFVFLGAAIADQITPAGQKLSQALDGMDVAQHWIAGQHVDWKTGDPDGKPGEKASHCSTFVAAASDRLGAYILRPPEHNQFLLANAQHEWLMETGASQGWLRIRKLDQAQGLANKGFLVVASFKNPDPKRPGHICIVRPAVKSPDQIENEGPEVISAGMQNYQSTTMKNAFRLHPGAFDKRAISLFAHATPFSGPLPAN